MFMKKLFTFLSVVLYTSAYAQPFNEYTKNWATYFWGVKGLGLFIVL